MRTRTGACHSRASVVVCACVCAVLSSFDEAGVSSAVMSAPWSLGVVRCCGTRRAALLLLPLSYAPVGWGSKTLKLRMLFVLLDVAVKDLKELIDRFG